MLSLLAVARLLYPRPQDLAAGPAQVTTAGPAAGVLDLRCAAAALAAAGFADFPLIAYHFQHARVPCPRRSSPVFYAVAMAVSGTGSLVLGRIFDRAGIGVLIPLTVVAAAYAPLVFLGGFWAILVGVSLWGLGMGVQESLIPAAVAPMVSPDRRASAYGLFTGIYGTAWVLGSIVIGVLVNVSLDGLVAFCDGQRAGRDPADPDRPQAHETGPLAARGRRSRAAAPVGVERDHRGGETSQPVFLVVLPQAWASAAAAAAALL